MVIAIVGLVGFCLAGTADVYMQTDGFEKWDEYNFNQTMQSAFIGGMAGMIGAATFGAGTAIMGTGAAALIASGGIAGAAGGFSSGFMTAKFVHGLGWEESLATGGTGAAYGAIGGMAGGVFGSVAGRVMGEFGRSFAGTVLTGTAGGALIGGGMAAGQAALTGGDAWRRSRPERFSVVSAAGCPRR